MTGLLFDVSYSAIMMVYLATGFFLLYRYCHVFLMCFGEIVLAGGYTAAYISISQQGTFSGFAISFFASGLVGVLAGGGLYWLLRVLSGRANVSAALFATWGLALVLAESYRLIFGAAGKYVSPSTTSLIEIFGSPIPTARIINIEIAAIVLGVLTIALFINKRWRLILEAQADSPQIARELGVPVSRLSLIMFVIASFLATTAGVLMSQDSAITPYSGVTITIQAALAALIVGPRLGHAIVVAAILGGTRTLLGYFVGLTHAWLIILALCVVLIGFSPSSVRRNLLGTP